MPSNSGDFFDVVAVMLRPTSSTSNTWASCMSALEFVRGKNSVINVSMLSLRMSVVTFPITMLLL